MTKFLELKKVYTKDYLILIGIGFLPLLWKILEIAFLSPFENALKILGQIALIGIIFKVFEEAILNPLFKCLSKQNIIDENDRQYIVKKFLLIYFILTLIFTIILLFCSEYILKASKVPGYILYETLEFVKIYIISCGLGVISKYLYTCSLIRKETKKLAIYLLIKSIATAILFVIFIPKFALGLGVNGVAVAEIIIHIVTIIYLLTNCVKAKQTDAKINVKEYFKLSVLSFFETLIRNVVYYFVVLVFLNMIDNQDLYFVANEYIWAVMLVPVLAQSSLIKQNYANDKKDLKPYFLNCIFLILFMLVLLPIGLFVFKHIYNLPNAYDYFGVLLKLFPCYIIFVIDSVIEAYFVATGKLHHILVQTILTNILVYCTALVLYWCGVLIITLDVIILLFNIGVVVSSIYTIIVYLIERRRSKSLSIG